MIQFHFCSFQLQKGYFVLGCLILNWLSAALRLIQFFREVAARRFHCRLLCNIAARLGLLVFHQRRSRYRLDGSFFQTLRSSLSARYALRGLIIGEREREKIIINPPISQFQMYFWKFILWVGCTFCDLMLLLFLIYCLREFHHVLVIITISFLPDFK